LSYHADVSSENYTEQGLVTPGGRITPGASTDLSRKELIVEWWYCRKKRWRRERSQSESDSGSLSMEEVLFLAVT
jgi:hypothetical protein